MIYLDIDNTVFNSIDKFIEIICKENDVKPNGKWEDVTAYNFAPVINGLTETKILDVFDHPDFYSTMHYMPGAKKAVTNLIDEYPDDVCFTTMGSNKNIVNKLNLIQETFPGCPMIVLTNIHNKRMLHQHNSIYVDDHPKNLIGAEIPVLYEHGIKKEWNKEWTDDVFKSWSDIETFIHNRLTFM
ncbi:5'(3')-deoxyribonucleotidase [Methanococcus maripaludis]|uniref:5'(3')-deoxyribonucleotidase n=1 Tax=Methanococcus maripaludis TaxID=39152 RepID=A0A7J9NWQ4_METMI|nr:hypothetical protein [Methanococcus maripaludis]MBA2851694.1 5'(3')-deoxyribonucleotidase [Methanococcus maripaludis]